MWQRALRGSGATDWQRDLRNFKQYAEASLGFGQTSLAQAELPEESAISAQQLLSAAILHLNRIVKNSREDFASEALHMELAMQVEGLKAARSRGFDRLHF